MYKIVLMAGGREGFVDGLGDKARFSRPNGLALSKQGVLFVTDLGNNAVRRVTPIGEVSTVAGGSKGGSTDGPAAVAGFMSPRDVAFDAEGNLYVADFGSNKLRRLSLDLKVSTLAGSGTKGAKDGHGRDASFSELRSITYYAGYIYAADRYSVRRISLFGQVSTWAGSTESGLLDGFAAQARFGTLSAIRADVHGNLFLIDVDNVAVRYITQLQKVGTLAGADVLPADGSNSILQQPIGIALDDQNNCWVTDVGDRAIKKISPQGVITEIYGSKTNQDISLEHPVGIAVGKDGRVYISDIAHHAIYCLIPSSC
ncbi:MAG: hypothetical protein RMM17_11325 [Acidobacteriota bacterium]|nr:hypothetical protein [Blastocatellia bacterium]MDW8413262.1 hypothetical protein [Acidobacteriota bacterium]